MIDDRAYPKMLAILPSRNSYRVFNGGLSSENLDEFLEGVFGSRWIKSNIKMEDYLLPNTEL